MHGTPIRIRFARSILTGGSLSNRNALRPGKETRSRASCSREGEVLRVGTKSWSYRQNLSDHAGVVQRATDAVCVTASRIDLETCCCLAPNSVFAVITGEEF